MKNNTQKSKEFLCQAIQYLPNDFALNHVRSHLKSVLQMIEAVEEKRQKRNIVQNTMQPFYFNPQEAKKIVAQLDDMINHQKNKIEEAKKKKEDTQDQTIFG